MAVAAEVGGHDGRHGEIPELLHRRLLKQPGPLVAEQHDPAGHRGGIRRDGSGDMLGDDQVGPASAGEVAGGQ